MGIRVIDVLQLLATGLNFEQIEKEATLEECIGLERFASWTAEGIEKRLNDYFFVPQMDSG